MRITNNPIAGVFVVRAKDDEGASPDMLGGIGVGDDDGGSRATGST